jgi:hypothetical protein
MFTALYNEDAVKYLSSYFRKLPATDLGICLDALRYSS